MSNLTTLFICYFMGSIAAWSQQMTPHAPIKEGASRTTRQRQLLQCLTNCKSFDRIRAAEELAGTWRFDEIVRGQLLTAISKYKGEEYAVEIRYVDILVATGPAGVPDIVRVYEGSTESIQRFVLLPALARLGVHARGAAPFLRDKLKDPQNSRGLDASIRMTLAHIGGDARAILTIAQERVQKGSGSAFPGFPLFCVRPNEWANKEFIDEVASAFSNRNGRVSGDVLHLHALFLGLMGDKASSATDLLVQAQQRAIRNGNNAAVTITLALARIDPKNQDLYLRRLFKVQLIRLRSFDRTMQALLSSAPYILIDSKLSTHLAQMVEDNDLAVADGAACLLWWAGLAGQDAFPRLQRYLRGSASSERRVHAANILGRVATFTQIRELEATLEEEKSDRVKKELKAAIDYIRLLGISPEDPTFLKNRYLPPLSSATMEH